MNRVLLYEPSAAVASAIRSVLEENGFAVETVAEPSDLKARGDIRKFAAIVVDVHRDEKHGLEAVGWIARSHASLMPRVVVITADEPEAIREALHQTGVCEVVVKPVSAPEILRAVIECMERSPEYSVQ
jgi:DNA-binding response OmpR family regulator